MQNSLLSGAQAALEEVARKSRGSDMLVVVGLPLSDGGKLYNCAAIVQGGRILGVVPKTHIPNYSEFYEARLFAPAPADTRTITLLGQPAPFGTKLLFCCQDLPELVVGIEICEDLWVHMPPSCALAAAGATVICNPSASDEIVAKDEYRRLIVMAQSGRLSSGYIYADAGQGESSTDFIYGAHNLIAENGALLSESALFENNMIYTELDVQRLDYERRRLSTFVPGTQAGFTRISFSQKILEPSLTRYVSAYPFVPADNERRAHRCEEILSMQSLGLKKRLAHTASKTAVIGISGGLDSTLALLVSARAMDMLGRPHTDIVAVTMPCYGTTDRTYQNAVSLAQTLGVTLREISISQAVDQHFADIGHDASNYNVVFENSQARERTQVLMDVANQTGGFVVGTGDLSELALGWATYNGDHMSMYAVNCSVPKTLVRHLIAHVAEKAGGETLERVLSDILDTPVSPELLPAQDGDISQRTEELVGPYSLHDFFLYYAVRWGFSPSKIYFLAKIAFSGEYESAVILQWLKVFFRRFFSQQFKRSCLPDGPKVGSVTLSPRGDWRMPSDASAALWLSELEQLS